MKSDAVRGNRTSLRIVSVILAVLCVFSVFAVRAIRMRPVLAKQEVWIEQAESSEELADDLAQRMGFSALTVLNSVQMEKYYAVPKNIAERETVYTEATESELHEIAVFRVSSNAERDAVMKAVNTRITTYTSAYNFANAENDAKKYFIGGSASYVVLIIGVPYARASSVVSGE